MKIRRLNDDNGRKVLQVEEDWSGISADYDDIVSACAKVQIPGFRPGKVPRVVIEQRLQKKILDDLSQRAAQRLGKEALGEAGTESLGPIEIMDIECVKGRPFQFTARFWPMPEIELPDLGSLHIRADGSDPRDLVSNRLLEEASFTVPDELVRMELKAEDGDADNGSAAWKAATDRVRLMFILNRIARQEGIEVSEADVERRIEEKAVEFGAEPKALRAELEEGGGTKRLKDMLLAERTLEYLVEKSTQRKGVQL